MPSLKPARTLNLLVLLVAIGGAVAVFAQVPAPRLADAPDAAPARERRLVQRLEQARQMLAPSDTDAKPDFAQGVRLLQSILDDGRGGENDLGAEDVFLDEPPPNERATVRSLKSDARRLLGGLPAEGRQAYGTLVAKIAQVEFDTAWEKRDWHIIASVSRRWFHTSAGYAATHALALRDLDAGEPVAAAQRLEELRDSPLARRVREPQLSLRLAVAWRLAGNNERCREVLSELKKSLGQQPLIRSDGSGVLPLFGQDPDAVSWLDHWAGAPLKPMRVGSEMPTEWPMAFGSAGRNAFAAPAAPAEHPAWSHSLLDDDADNGDEQDSPVEADGKESQREGTDPPLKVIAGANDGRSPTTLPGRWGRVRVEIRTVIEQRMQAERPVLSTAQPIVVGDAVVVRTLSQLRAFRLSDGEPLWQSASLDAQLGELLDEPRRGRIARTARPKLEAWLQQRVWDDFGSGTLSSDGELVYSLQERGGGMFQPPQMAWRGMFLPQEFNKLVAVEVRTGRMRWELGGPRSDQELLGAGAFFLGPPLPWRGELFVLTDDGVDVRLIVLDPRDGRLLWIQTLSASDPIWSSVARDAGLSPSVAGDCVICPTGAGSVVAVDPVRRELRWQTRYREAIERTARRRFEFHLPNTTIETCWQQGVILVSGDRLLVASPDHNELICLNTADGRVLWKQPRGDGLFVVGVSASGGQANGDHVSGTALAAGVDNSRKRDESPRTQQSPRTEQSPRASAPSLTESDSPLAIIVGQNEVRAVRLADGELAWPQPAPIAAPCGRGVLIDGVLHLPVISNDGEVISLETRSGRLLARTELPKLLGNLIAANGQLVSQSAAHIVAFPAVSELQQNFARALARQADDAQTLERRGRLNLHLGHRQRGMEDLRRSVALQTTPEAKHTLATLLLEELRLDQANIDSTIRELETLIDDPRQRLMFARLRAESLQRRGEPLAAARELLKLADAWELDSELENFGGNGSARQDRWIAARLAELQESLSPAERQTLNDELQTRLHTALESSGHMPLRRFLALFGASDSAMPARRALIERLDSKKHRHEFEATLLTLRRSQQLESQAFATGRLAQQWLTAEQFEMSRPLLDELSSRFADVRCLDQQTGRELAKRWKAEFRTQLETTWPAEPLQSERVGTNEPIERTYPIEWAGALDPFHDNWRLSLDASRRTLMARDAAGRVAWRWKLPLDEQTVLEFGNSAIWHGRWLVLILGDRFLVADTIALDGSPSPMPRVLWQGILFDRRQFQAVTLTPAQQPTPIDGVPTRIGASDSSGRRLGRVAIVGDDVLCFQTGSRLTAAQLTTGEPLWMFDGLSAGCDLSGDDRAVVATPHDSHEAIVLSTLDGRSLARRELGPSTKLASVGRNMLTWTQTADGHQLRLTDLLTNADLLNERFAVGAKPCLSLRDTVAVVEPSGRFTLWSLSDGRRLLEKMLAPIEHLRHVLMLRDRDRWLLLTYVEPPAAPGQSRPRIMELYFDQWRVHGPCFAFDRSTGKQLWSAELGWQGINAAQATDVPILVLAARIYQPNPANPRLLEGLKYTVDVLDKRTGRLLTLADDLVSQQLNFCEQRPNADRKSIDVQIDHNLHRLSFGDPPKK